MAVLPLILTNGTTADADEVMDLFYPLYNDISPDNVDASNKTGTGKFVLDTNPTITGATFVSPIGVVAFVTGHEHIDANNYGRLIWKNPRVNASLKLMVWGEEFHRAHYTEMPSHNHTQDSHTHTGTTDSTDLSHTHSIDSHTHTFTTDAGGIHTHQLLVENNPGNLFCDMFQSGTGVWDAGSPPFINDSSSHTHNGTTNGTSANTGSALTGHTHTFTTASTTATNQATGTTTTESLSASEKTWLNSMAIYIDGVDKTTELLALAEANYAGSFSAFGDGTSGHRINNRTLTSPGPGTGEMLISSLATTQAFHEIEFRQSGGNGGKINWYLEVA